MHSGKNQCHISYTNVGIVFRRMNTGFQIEPNCYNLFITNGCEHFPIIRQSPNKFVAAHREIFKIYQYAAARARCRTAKFHRLPMGTCRRHPHAVPGKHGSTVTENGWVRQTSVRGGYDGSAIVRARLRVEFALRVIYGAIAETKIKKTNKEPN